MEKIAVIGDSHVNFFGGNDLITFIPIVDQNNHPIGMNNTGDLIENFTTFHLGPALAYNLTKYGSTNRTKEKIDLLLNAGIIKSAQPILCVFGEIDCRVHVLRQADKRNVNYKVVIDDILENYGNFLFALSKKHPVYVWGPTASRKSADDWRQFDLHSTDDNEGRTDIPYYGSEVERNIATAYFNERLKVLCDKLNITFVSIFKYLVDENNRTRSEYIADAWHLSQRAWAFAIDEWKAVGIDIKFNPKWQSYSFNSAIQFENRSLLSNCSMTRAEEIQYINRIRNRFQVMDIISKDYVRKGAPNVGGFVMVNDFSRVSAIYDCTSNENLSWSTALSADLSNGGG